MSDTPGPKTMAEALDLLQQRDNDLRLAAQQLAEARRELDDIRRAEARSAAVLLSCSDTIISMTPDGLVQTWNPGAHMLLGHPAASIVGKPFQSLMPPKAQELFSRALDRIRAGGRAKPYETRWLRADGSQVDVAVSVLGFAGSSGDLIGVWAVAHDIATQLQAQQQLERSARFDNLTGLASRAEAIARLESALSQPRTPGPRLGVLHCDVDHFKTVNDTWGLAAGDLVLATLAERIRGRVRGGDTVGRMGGDEMLVVLPHIHDLKNLKQIAEKIRALAHDPIPYKRGKTIEVTLSIGATLAVDDESVQTLMIRAADALNAAKQAGRNTVASV